MILRRFMHDRKLPSVSGQVMPILKKIGTKSPKLEKINQPLKNDYYLSRKNHLHKTNVYGHYKNLNDVIKASKPKST